MELAILIISFVAPLIMKIADRIVDHYFPKQQTSEHVASEFNTLLHHGHDTTHKGLSSDDFISNTDFTTNHDEMKLDGEAPEPEMN